MKNHPPFPGHMGIIRIKQDYYNYSFKLKLLSPTKTISVSEHQKTGSIQFGYWKCRTDAWMLSPTIVHMNSPNEVIETEAKGSMQKRLIEHDKKWQEKI